jgi:5-methylcytosine-specific restriction endonuclease McrA
MRQTNALCQCCKAALTTEVHHKVPLSVDPSRAYDASNLVALCQRCHQQAHRSTA